MNSLPSLIAQHRKSAKLTQAQLAHLVGVSRTTIYQFENGKGNITHKVLEAICDKLKLKIELHPLGAARPVFCIKEKINIEP